MQRCAIGLVCCSFHYERSFVVSETNEHMLDNKTVLDSDFAKTRTKQKMPHEIWTSDFEVFAHDWLFVAKRMSDGKTVAVWNDPEEVQDFCDTLQPVLCGFNYRDYDSHILKAVLLGWSPEDIKHVNDTIIDSEDRSHIWALFNGQPWVELPPIIDLWHDVVPRKGLKEIEANIGMDIVESSVPFDIDRPLTKSERAEVLRYCIHDVDATEALYDLRLGYLKSKTTLCELRDVDPLTMLKHTNARIVSEVLDAEKMATLPFETYEIPANVDQSALPQQVIDYVTQWNTENCTEKKPETCDFLFHGCPTVVGLGGIHAAVPSYKETSTAERVILSQDVGSYYPSLIINNGYMSRAVPDESAYKQFYDLRMSAKAKGDKETAEAAKLVLNTTFGTMKDHYNKMYDPMQATRVCLSGQVYIIDLIEQMHRAIGDDMTLIQLNTDGWVISCSRSNLPAIEAVVSQWQERTGFTLETDEIETIVQANVNNYCLRTAAGKVKTKGGVVARYSGGDFKSNSMTIIDKAVVDYLLDGIEIETTISGCEDIERFQIVAKAGRTYREVVWNDVPVQRVNRVYATTNHHYGDIVKVKGDRREKIPLTPDHCFVDNENVWRNTEIGLTTLDKSWYVALATKKAKEFITRSKKEIEQMSDVAEKTNELTEEKPKVTRKKAEKKVDEGKPTTETTESVQETLTFGQKLLKLQELMAGASTGVSFDSAVSNIGYEYADTQQYKKWLNQACLSCGLIFKLSVNGTWHGIITPDDKKPTYGASAAGYIEIINADNMCEREVYEISGFGSNVQSGYCEGAAQTNAIRNFILNNFNLDNKGREGDDQAFNAAEQKTSGYVSPEGKAAIRQGIAEAKADEKKYATDMYATALFAKIADARKVGGNAKFFASCDTLIAEHFDGEAPKLRDGGKSTIPKDEAVKYMTKAEEIVAKAGE